MFKPGKGVRVTVDRDVATFLEDAMAELNEATYHHIHNDENAIDHLYVHFDWDKESDQYGEKATKSIELDNGNELRIALVATPKGDLKVDIREWYAADEG